MVEDRKNNLLTILINNKIHYGILIILLALVIVKYKLNKKKVIELWKRRNIIRNNQRNKNGRNENINDENEEEEEEDIELNIEIIKEKDEDKKRRKNKYYHLIAENFSNFYRMNPISVYMMIHQDSSSTTNPASSPEHPQTIEEHTPSSSSKKLYKKDGEFRQSSLQNILKSESNDSISHSHHSKFHHRKSPHERNGSQSSISSAVSSESNESHQSVQSNKSGCHRHLSKDKRSYSSISESNQKDNTDNQPSALQKTKNSFLSKSHSGDKLHLRTHSRKHSSSSSLQVSTSNISESTMCQSPVKSPVNKSSPLKMSYSASQTNIVDLEATTSNSTTNNSNINPTTETTETNANVPSSSTSATISPQNNTNKYSSFFGSFNSIKESVFGKPRSKFLF